MQHMRGASCRSACTLLRLTRLPYTARRTPYRGLDNRVYYMLAPGGEYYNYSGCGNTLNCNQPVVRQFILDCLRYWVTEYHVDGFRWDRGQGPGAGSKTRPHHGTNLCRLEETSLSACERSKDRPRRRTLAVLPRPPSPPPPASPAPIGSTLRPS